MVCFRVYLYVLGFLNFVNDHLVPSNSKHSYKILIGCERRPVKERPGLWLRVGSCSQLSGGGARECLMPYA